MRYYTAFSKTDVEAAAKREGRSLRMSVIAWSSTQKADPLQHTFGSIEEMHAHFGSESILQASRTAITWCFFSPDYWAADAEEQIAAIDAEVKGRQATIQKLTAEMKAPRDSLHFDQVRGQIEAQRAALKQNAEQRLRATEDVIGILSTVPFSNEIPADRLLAATAPVALSATS